MQLDRDLTPCNALVKLGIFFFFNVVTLIIKSSSVAGFDSIPNFIQHYLMENGMLLPMVYVSCHLNQKMLTYECSNLGASISLSPIIMYILT